MVALPGSSSAASVAPRPPGAISEHYPWSARLGLRVTGSDAPAVGRAGARAPDQVVTHPAAILYLWCSTQSAHGMQVMTQWYDIQRMNTSCFNTGVVRNVMRRESHTASRGRARRPSLLQARAPKQALRLDPQRALRRRVGRLRSAGACCLPQPYHPYQEHRVSGLAERGSP